MNTAPTVKRRKSVALTEDELKALKAFRRRFRTESEFDEALGLKRIGRRVLVYGSGSPKTIDTIRAVIQNDMTAKITSDSQ